jgi:flagellar biosynthesis GTPase FlhF
MKKMILILIIFASAFAFSENKNNEDSFSNYGIYSDFNLLMNSADFKELNGCVNCSNKRFTNVLGNGFTLGGIYDYNLNNYSIEARAGLNFSESGEFNSSNIVVVGLSYEPQNVEFINRIKWNTTSINLQLGLKYSILKNVNVSIDLGTNIFVSSNFVYKEKINDPSMTFISSGSSERIVRNGEIPNLKKFQFYGAVQISYDIPMNKNHSILLRPQLAYNLAFNDMIKWDDEDSYWKMNKLKFGFSLVYSNGVFAESISNSEQNEIFKQKEDSLFKEKSAFEKEVKEKNTAELKQKEDELAKMKLEMANKEKLLADMLNKEKSEAEKIAAEKLEMQRVLDAQNANNCKCYYVLFNTFESKDKADKLLAALKSKGFKDISLELNVDNSVRMTFYRIRSKCYDKSSDAIDVKYKANILLSDVDFDPLIICDK